MSGKLKRMFFSFAVIVIFIAVSAILIYQSLNAPYGEGSEITIIIKEGMSTHDISELLFNEKLIRYPGFLRWLCVYRHLDRALMAGKYRLKPSMRVKEILDTLTRGDILYENVTIPEGLTIKETASLLSQKIGIDASRFESLCRKRETAEKLEIDASDLEGYLFPETYSLFWGIDEFEVIENMVTQFFKVVDETMIHQATISGMTLKNMVILASIIELEARLDEERPIISQVYHKRLKIGMTLGADPTLQFALGEKRRLTSKDKKIKSPYNTYLHAGLPPGPICSPGKASLIAALEPADTNFLYFVARGDGSHVFSKTNRDHINAKNRIKRERRKKL